MNQKREKKELKDENQLKIQMIKNSNLKLLNEKDEIIKKLLNENEKLNEKCFDLELKLKNLRIHYDQLDSFRNVNYCFFLMEKKFNFISL